MSQLSFRFAEADDSRPFAEWVNNNPLIAEEDITASLKANNPTSVTLVIEDESGVKMFASGYCQFHIAHLAYNPETDGKERLRAMAMMQKAIAAFSRLHGINEVTVSTYEDYPVAKWAMKHGFEVEPRQTLKLDARKIIGESPNVQ